MEKSNKKILISIIMAIIIIIVIIGILLILNKKNEKESKIDNELSTVQPKEETQKTEEINEITYYNIGAQIKKFYAYIDKSNYINRDGSSTAEDEDTKRSIYNLLSKEYIEKEKITVENIYEHIPEINETTIFVATDIQKKERGSIKRFMVEGLQITLNDANKDTQVKILINIDEYNNTFSIEPIKENANENIEITEIPKNENNTYEMVALSEQELIKEKFYNFKLLILRKNKDLYNMFDEEYRNRKFGDYEGYTKYVENNYERLSTMYLTKYKVDNLDDYTQYVCIDNYGRYCIFRNKTSTDMDILLDTYTVDLPEFIEKYNKAGEQEKVGMNIEKFINAINEQDYKYGYGLLDDVFKRNNMSTQQDFENYVKNNMYENNVLEHNEVNKQGNTFVYELSIKDKNNENAEAKRLTVIMQLEEGTDFVMSFSMN